MERITGSVERITYHNPENGYCVLRVKVQGKRDLVTLVGNASSITAGETVEALGSWTQHKEFGLQFQGQDLKTIPPSTLEGMEKYLGSGMVKGIGPHFAKLLVDKFGLEVFEIIDKTPENLRKVPGIGSVRIQKITQAWSDQKVIRDIMIFLQSHGVSTSKAVRIYKTYGKDAVIKVTQNPYQLARDIHGIGFKSADLIASHLGVKKDSLLRARAGLQHVLQEKLGEGHCAYPRELLIEESRKLLEIDTSILNESASLEIADGYLVEEPVDEQICVYPSWLYKVEQEVARLLKKLSSEPVPWEKINTDTAIHWVEKKLALQLAPLQKEAVGKALESKVVIITGGPGTGKTTLTRAIVTILQAKKVKILACSPTGRAAKRLSECTGLEAKTIHRMLGINRTTGGFLHDKGEPLLADLLLLDEASMVDLPLMYNLLKAIPSHCALVIVGDRDQIPSVGPGALLQSLIECEQLPVVRLIEIFRQAAKSQIISSAHKINHGEFPLIDSPATSDFHFLISDEPDTTAQKILDLVKNRIPHRFGFNPVRDIQVLCPMNRGVLGARSLNISLQKVLNPNPQSKVERFGITFATGDKIIVTANDYDKEVFNGDIGFIESIQTDEQTVLVTIDERKIEFDFSEMDLLALAYAITIHKSQGSEYPVVVIPVHIQHYLMLKRNLIYTGVTRGKKLVIVIGQKKAMAMALTLKNQSKRWNNLTHRLRGF